MNAIFKRKSVRSFIDKKIEIEKLNNIINASNYAPSAHNYKPWELIVISDDHVKEKISKMSPYAVCAKSAEVLVIVLCDLLKVSKDPIWWVQDLSAVTQNILLQATDEGIGSVWLGFYPEMERTEKLKDFLNLSENLIPFSVVALGYSNEAFRDDNKEIFAQTNIKFID